MKWSRSTYVDISKAAVTGGGNDEDIQAGSYKTEDLRSILYIPQEPSSSILEFSADYHNDWGTFIRDGS